MKMFHTKFWKSHRNSVRLIAVSKHHWVGSETVVSVKFRCGKFSKSNWWTKLVESEFYEVFKMRLALKMKLFEIVRRNFAILGISPHKHPFNRNSLETFFICGLSCILCGVFLICNANTFREYTESIYMTTMQMVIASIFTIVVVKTSKLFQFVDDFEKYIENRKLTTSNE